ncbi:MAG: protein kinase [Verrucomicrobiota bacterium]
MASSDTAMTQPCPACGTPIDTTNADPLSRVACPKCGEKVRVDRMFDQFLLVETLGLGGMGTVYKARDTLLDRMVALKLLRKDLEGGIDQTKQLQQEARVAASVNNPNVVQVFSSGTDHGQFYLVMELVDHGSLDDFIEQQKRLPEVQVLETGIQVAKGLRAAYAKGLIHRDVKPANILFSDEHTAKIGDFGLAGAAAQGAEDRGEIWGTPYYVAPERLNNEPEDFRSDIYSLGATLFHAISGTAPIEGETNSAVTLLNLKKEPIDLATIAPDVSDPTANLLRRMIALAPADRFLSYDELVAELENAYGLLTGKEEFLKQRRSKMPWLIGVAVLAVALVGVGTWAYFSHQHAQTALGAESARANQLAALAPLEARAAEGRRRLVLFHFDIAATAFEQIASEAKGKQPFYDWMRLQQGLSALIGRKTTRANEAFEDVQKAGETGFPKKDKDLATFFVATAKRLATPGPVPASEVAGNADSYRAFALLAFGVKDFIEADIADATALLQQFVDSKPSGDFAWIAELKPIAKKYLRDSELYVEWKSEAAKAQDPAAITASLGKLQDLKKRLKPYPAISNELNAEEAKLNERLGTQPKAEATPEKNQQTTQQFAQKKMQWLAEWKSKLIADLNRTHFAGAVVDVSGAQYTGITGATDQTLKMKLPYGEAQLPWVKLAPKSLLAISTSFVKPKAPDAADRQWACAVYASETGQKDEAVKLAEAAAKAKPEYRDQISLLAK